MQKWEYMVRNGWPTEADLNKLGDECWELVTIVAAGSEGSMMLSKDHAPWGPQYVFCYFKRPKPE
jgi:hypothetical protein